MITTTKKEDKWSGPSHSELKAHTTECKTQPGPATGSLFDWLDWPVSPNLKTLHLPLYFRVTSKDQKGNFF